MAFDGIVVAGLADELKNTLLGGRIAKIAQPETDELLFTIKTQNGQKRLCLSASASLPLVYLTVTKKPRPMSAPGFCMLLRKHIANGRIVNISQPGLERILHFTIEHLNEMGDLCRKDLVVEIMGKHSNIIFCAEDGTIIDSIKHVSAQMSSVREVLPGRTYFVPDTMQKHDPLTVSEAEFCEILRQKPMPLGKALYTSFTGISPVVAEEICHLAGADSDIPAGDIKLAANVDSHALSKDTALTDGMVAPMSTDVPLVSNFTADTLSRLYQQFVLYLGAVREARFAPAIYYGGKEPKDFSALPLSHFANYTRKDHDSISEVIETYYASKNAVTRIRQKSTDLRHIVQTALERNRKKFDLQSKQLADTEGREKYRVYGELLNTYGYQLEPGAKSLEALNYYTDEMIKIPLDTAKTAQENAQRYFEKYNKQKRTAEALSRLTEETKNEINYLESVRTALDIALTEDDLAEIKEELVESGYMRRKYSKKKVKIKNQPLHFVSSDGFHMYVGKNNLQNDELTFHFANGGDWWFHAKQVPGSHVIVKANGQELPDTTFEEAGRLAAYYSSMRDADKIEVDYVEKKHVKKTPGTKPGFVIYYTNYSLVIDSDISGIEQIR